MIVLLFGFLIYGFIGSETNGSLEIFLFSDKIPTFLYWGLLGGLSFSFIVSSIILFAHFISRKTLVFKILCAALFPITLMIELWIGFFMYIPYEVYNFVEICTTPKK